MNFLFLLLTLTCPDINGEFLCKALGTEFYETMKTRIEDNIYVYEFHLPSGEITTLYADDIKRPYNTEFQGMDIQGHVVNKCLSGSLITNFSGRSKSNDLVGISTTTTRNGNNLKMEFLIYLNNKLHEKVEETCTQAAF